MIKRRIGKICKYVIGFLIVSYLFICIVYKFDIISKPFLYAVHYAVIINLVNSSIAFLLCEFSFRKSNKTFLISVIGGMSIRLIILLAVIFISLEFLNIDKYGFILTFFIFYFYLLIIEINYLQNRAKTEEK
ncbi:MAG: hypothetical protein A2V66_17050 [Ignavibacteria bacterium RBG_13_36_8]|nr:MAG: hypothetical protein A2V66_17050 [Ignavibacteria bacterium RBG_13_36_8]